MSDKKRDENRAISRRPGRPRSQRVHQAALDAAFDLLAQGGFSGLSIDKVAAYAGVSKAAIYRRWSSKEALAAAVLDRVAQEILPVADAGSTRAELVAMVSGTVAAFAHTPLGRVMKSLLSEIALSPELTAAVRWGGVRLRREEVERALRRGVARGEIRADADLSVAHELLLGPVYYRLLFGGELDRAFAEQVVDAVLAGYFVEENLDAG